MIFNIRKLSRAEKDLCLKTVSSKAIFAMVGDAISERKSISIVRMGDGERRILEADGTKPFIEFEQKHENWNKRMGIEGIPINILKQRILDAGNTCTYFAPSVSGISFPHYNLYPYFNVRPFYFDNFFVNDWTFAMIQMLFEASEGIFIIHREFEEIIQNFKKNYNLSNKKIEGTQKNSWNDNESVIEAARNSGMQLILFSAGPSGKIIGPEIAKFDNKIVLDVGNTLIPWSIKTPNR